MFPSLRKLCQGRPIYVQTHNYPDPDALAAGHGLCQLFRALGERAVLCFDGQLDKRSGKKMAEVFDIRAAQVRTLVDFGEDPILICVDSQGGNGNITELPLPISACIDHHPVVVRAEYLYQDIRPVGACASIIASYFSEAGIDPDASTASCLLFGIQNDTRQFTRGVAALDIDMFQFLSRFSDPEELRSVSANLIAFSDLKAYSSAIDTIRIYGNVALSEVELPCSDDLVAMISDFFMSLDGVDVCIVFNRRADGIKISVRSEWKEVDAGALASRAIGELGSGGGHAYMAGGFIPAARVPELGVYADETIRDLFLCAMEEIACNL